MKIVCLVKFIPDVDNFIYDYELNVLVRENVHLVINPDDACALAYALKLKEKNPEITVETVTMGPLSVKEYIRDLLRRNVDKATLISDKMFVGSDTYATSRILGKYLQSTEFDLIMSGSHTLDGDTAHVPVQIAEMMNLAQMSGIKKFFEDESTESALVFETERENTVMKFEAKLPAVLSTSKDSGYKLPYVKYADLNLYVDDRITLITNDDLGFDQTEVGLKGSLTKVAKTYTKQQNRKESIFVTVDEQGIETVYGFLKDKGLV